MKEYLVLIFFYTGVTCILHFVSRWMELSITLPNNALTENYQFLFYSVLKQYINIYRLAH